MVAFVATHRATILTKNGWACLWFYFTKIWWCKVTNYSLVKSNKLYNKFSFRMLISVFVNTSHRLLLVSRNYFLCFIPFLRAYYFRGKGKETVRNLFLCFIHFLRVLICSWEIIPYSTFCNFSFAYRTFINFLFFYFFQTLYLCMQVIQL